MEELTFLISKPNTQKWRTIILFVVGNVVNGVGTGRGELHIQNQQHSNQGLLKLKYY